MIRKLALITPWPPQHTGIADYAYDLAWGLVQMGYEISVISEVEEPRLLDGVRFYPPEWLTDKTSGQFDQLVYQLGNNVCFHVFQVPLLFRYPGVVHLHDMVLHHLMVWLLCEHGSPKLYRRVLAKWYGPVIAESGWQALSDGRGIWCGPEVTHVPFFEELVQHASALITHSEFAARKVRAAFPALSVMVLPQLYREVIPSGNTNDGSFHIGVFGGVDTNKRLDLIIDATLSALQAGCSIQLHIAGSVHENCRPLLERVHQSPLKGVTHIHGRVGHEELLKLISEMDICMALRYPTMGETSAIVMRALQAGTPVIVNDVGWYSELPEFLPKLLPTGPDELKELTELLTAFSSKGPEYQALRAETLRYAETVCQFDRVTKDYANFVLGVKQVVQ